MSQGDYALGQNAPTIGDDTARVPTSADPSIGQATPQTPTVAASHPLNEERLEASWITRIKRVIQVTRDDPYEQSQQIARLRAEYMYRRFQKTVKLPEDTAA